MKQKKKIWFYIIGTFLLAFPFHFGYDIFPNPVNAIFFPVNESIWEHMKMLFTTYLWFGVIEYPLLKHFRQDTKNEWFALWICSLLIIPIFLLLFLPIYSIIGEQMIVTIVLMFIAIAITKWIQFHLLEHVQESSSLFSHSIPRGPVYFEIHKTIHMELQKKGKRNSYLFSLTTF